MSAPGEPIDVAGRWLAEWPGALAAWSSTTQLRAPQFFDDDRAALRDRMAGEIAAIRLRDQVVMVNLATVRGRKLEDHALAVLAHEIGHHVYAPGNLTDDARMLAAMNRVLVGLPPRTVKLAGNLYQDLLINDRLQRRAGVDVAAVYRKLADGGKAPPRPGRSTRGPTSTSGVSPAARWRLPASTPRWTPTRCCSRASCATCRGLAQGRAAIRSGPLPLPREGRTGQDAANVRTARTPRHQERERASAGRGGPWRDPGWPHEHRSERGRGRWGIRR